METIGGGGEEQRVKFKGKDEHIESLGRKRGNGFLVKRRIN